MIKCRICGDEFKDLDRCPGCGNSIIAPVVVAEKIVIKKQVVNDEIKVDIDGDGKPDVTIKKTKFFKKGKK